MTSSLIRDNRITVTTLGDLLFGASGRTPSLDETAAFMLNSVSGPRFLYFWPGGR